MSTFPAFYFQKPHHKGNTRGRFFRQAGGLQVELPITETDLSYIHTGMEALLYLPGAEEQVSSTIAHIDPSLDPASRTARARAHIPPEYASTVKPGMSAQADLILARETAVPAVPASSLIRQDDGSWAVYRIGEDRAKKVAVEVGLTDGRYTAIKGLNPGDTVAADNTGQLYDGAPVYIFNQEEMQHE